MSIRQRFVVDTNILLVSVSSKSQYHWVFKKILDQEIELAVTTDILAEYEEIIAGKYSVPVAQNVIRTLLLLPNVIQTTIYYKWRLIENDRDDDKFVDCAIASNAAAIITHDKHFSILETLSFPPVAVLTLPGLQAHLDKQNNPSPQ